MSTPTIVVLNDYCHINGGASRVAIDEAAALARAGMRVIFFGTSGPICDALSSAPLETICLHQPELIEAGKHPGVMLQGLWNRPAHARMEQLLRTLNPQSTVVHLHGYTKSLTTSPLRCALNLGFPVIHTLHDFFSACPNGAFFDYARSAPCPKRGLSLDCISTQCDKRHYAHKLYRVARSAIQRSAGHMPGGVRHYIPLSSRSIELLKPYLPADARFHPLENPIDAARLPPVDVAANTSLVTVGRLDIEKGIETLLEAAARAQVPLTLIGEGPLREKAQAHPHVRITGWLSPAQVSAELEHARCLAFPSLWYETYGLVVAEAAARGIPAIVSNISAAAERVEHGIHGLHIPPGDVAALAQALEIIKDNAAVRAMGQAAYARFWENPPTLERHIAQLQEIYHTVLSAERNAA